MYENENDPGKYTKTSGKMCFLCLVMCLFPH